MGVPFALSWLFSATAAAAGPAASAQVESDAPKSRTRGKVEVSQVVGADTTMTTADLRTEARLNLDAVTGEGWVLNADGRASLRWPSEEHQIDVSRLYVGHIFGSTTEIDLGRIITNEVHFAEVDGARLILGLGSDGRFSLFGGFQPHPFTGAFDSRFLGAGAGYDIRTKGLEHGGGVSFSMFDGQADRLFLTERMNVDLGGGFRTYARLVLDTLSPNGLTASGALSSIDVSLASARVAWKASTAVSISLDLEHVHATQPHRYWQDWVDAERDRRGFTIDGPTPAGSRRSIAKLNANLHFGNVRPYAVGRVDFRHEDEAVGFEARGGVKVDADSFYADASGTQRSRFGVKNQLASIGGGFMTNGLTLDAQATAMRSPWGNEQRWLFDLQANGYVALDFITRGTFFAASYALFVDPDSNYHVGLARLGVRIAE